jgi:hypothetical protein
VPFPDELARGLTVVAYDRRWPADFAVLARRIHGALGQMAVRVSHVGSTSVPGLAAKDCIDVQVEVQALDEELITCRFEQIGFRLRPEPWDHVEATPGGPCPKLVFAPPEGERAGNIHVLEAASEAAWRKLNVPGLPAGTRYGPGCLERLQAAPRRDGWRHLPVRPGQSRTDGDLADRG